MQTAEQARAQARIELGKLADGVDPSAEKKRGKALSVTLREVVSEIRALPYERAFEPEADAVIEAAVRAGVWPPAWDGLSEGTWRVLLERHLQGMRPALNNEKSGNSVMAFLRSSPDTIDATVNSTKCVTRHTPDKRHPIHRPRRDSNE